MLTTGYQAALCMCRAAFAAIMTAVFVAILSSKVPIGIEKKLIPALLKAGLPASSLPAFMKALASGDASQFANVPGFTAQLAEVMQVALSDAYSYAYQYVYYALLAIGSLAVILGFFLKDYNKLLTSHIARTIAGPSNKLDTAVKPRPNDNFVVQENDEEKISQAVEEEQVRINVVTKNES